MYACKKKKIYEIRLFQMMWRWTFLVMVVVGCNGQNRPFYAARPQQYPTLLSRFGDTESSLSNRVGESEAPTPRPIIYVGGSVVDQDLIDRVATWPRDKQPFWFVNNQAIQNQVQNSPSMSNLPPPRSSFLGGR